MRARYLMLVASLLCGCARSTSPPPASPSSPAGAPEQAAAEPNPGGQSGDPNGSIAAPPARAQRTSSGVAWVVLTPGTSTESPGPEGKVVVHYTGWTRDGRLFDSSETRGPTTLPLAHTIPGFRDGVASMTKGEKRRIWIPAELAYGDAPRQEGAPAGQLTFDVELLEILRDPTVPGDVASPGPGATVLPSGLAYVVLRPGTSTERPTDASLITVHYSGWTRDGRMFDSSVSRGQPFQFRSSQVIPGWAEGIQYMTVGSIYRFWIPAELAYGEAPRRAGAPAGQLTFDVELIAIE